jgi:hypothetical protein
MHRFMLFHASGFAWHDKGQGSFRANLFLLVDFPLSSHIPWVDHNSPLIVLFFSLLFYKDKHILEKAPKKHSIIQKRSIFSLFHLFLLYVVPLSCNKTKSQ